MNALAQVGSQHPWQTQRWRQHVGATAQRLLLFAVQKGCPCTAAWLLQLLQELHYDMLEICKVGLACLPCLPAFPGCQHVMRLLRWRRWRRWRLFICSQCQDPA